MNMCSCRYPPFDDARQLTRFGGEEQEVATYKRPFLDVPTLKHHVHPFYVIYNTLPNLRKHCGELDDDQMGLCALIIEIDARWRLSSSSRPGKRRRLPESDDGGDDARQYITRAAAAKRLKSGAEACRIRGKPNASKSKGRAKGLERSASISESYLMMRSLRGLRQLPLLGSWSHPSKGYKLPKQWSRFCSSDWPLYFYSYTLWMPYNGHTTSRLYNTGNTWSTRLSTFMAITAATAHPRRTHCCC